MPNRSRPGLHAGDGGGRGTEHRGGLAQLIRFGPILSVVDHDQLSAHERQRVCALFGGARNPALSLENRPGHVGPEGAARVPEAPSAGPAGDAGGSRETDRHPPEQLLRMGDGTSRAPGAEVGRDHSILGVRSAGSGSPSQGLGWSREIDGQVVLEPANRSTKAPYLRGIYDANATRSADTLCSFGVTSLTNWDSSRLHRFYLGG